MIASQSSCLKYTNILEQSTYSQLIRGIVDYNMCGQQSQTSSTHQVSFETKLKKTLRLNRDRVDLLFAKIDGVPKNPWWSWGISYRDM